MGAGLDADRCRYFKGLFSPYITGRLEPPEGRALAEHLQHCEVCSGEFGRVWREAATAAAGRIPFERRRRRPLPGGLGIWLLLIGSFLGILVLGVIGLLDRSKGLPGGPLVGVGVRSVDTNEISRVLDVQATLMKAILAPLLEAEHPVGEADRAAAAAFFASLTAPAGGRAGVEPAWYERFHRLFRAFDLAPGARDWDRTDFLRRLSAQGLPPVVLVSVRSALERVLVCQVAWGERAAIAWLLDEERRVRQKGAGYRLLLLLFVRP